MNFDISKPEQILYHFFSHLISVPITTIEGVVGNKVQLPCDIHAPNDDNVNMVLWFKEDGGDPIYR